VPRDVPTKQVIFIQWDDQAQVWVATSDDVPGLATESPLLYTLVQKLRILVPELNSLNSALLRR